MEEILKQILSSTQNYHSLIYLSLLCIFVDFLTGIIKAIKNKNYKSNINRQGMYSKIAWILILIFGFLFDYILNIKIIFYIFSCSCIFIEFMSILENVNELGIKILHNFFGSDEK